MSDFYIGKLGKELELIDRTKVHTDYFLSESLSWINSKDSSLEFKWDNMGNIHLLIGEIRKGIDIFEEYTKKELLYQSNQNPSSYDIVSQFYYLGDVIKDETKRHYPLRKILIKNSYMDKWDTIQKIKKDLEEKLKSNGFHIEYQILYTLSSGLTIPSNYFESISCWNDYMEKSGIMMHMNFDVIYNQYQTCRLKY